MWVILAFKCECTSLYSFSGNAANPTRNQGQSLHLLGIEPGHCVNPHAQRALWLKRECLPFGESNPSLPRDTLHELHEILLGIASHADCAATGGAQGYKQTQSVGYKQKCFRPVSNRGPFACEANVITTTLRKQALMSRWAPACLLSILRQQVQLQLMSSSDDRRRDLVPSSKRLHWIRCSTSDFSNVGTFCV